MARPAPYLASTLAALALVVSQPLEAQTAVTRIEGLGSLSFPNSGSPEAQGDFLRGVLLLHSFEYGYAADAFRQAQAIDPDFAMAYWGEAMTYTHPVWNEKDAEAAHEALSRLAPSPEQRLARVPTARERGYFRAIETLYGEGDKAALDTLYAQEMEALATEYPDDLEAQTFHALALLGLSQGDRDIPTYMEAGAIALDAFEKNAGHPGAAHYVIHSFDDPTHAVLAMEAARAYAVIAPDAGHAQHMTTHIFLARGMWNDVVDANIRADAVSDRNLAARELPQTDCGHYNEWLMYGYQQQGRYDDAEALLMGCFRQAHDERLSPTQRRSAAGSYTAMRSSQLADTRNWSGEPAMSEVDASMLSTVAQLRQTWGSSMAALHRGERRQAEEGLAALERYGGTDAQDWASPYVPVWTGTLRAMLLEDARDLEGAVAAAREAADYEASLPVDFGPPIAYKPARELEGEMLLAAGHAEEAMGAFEQALARTPNRVLTLAGYARAAQAAGRADVALSTYAALAELLEAADADMPESLEAQAALADPAER